MATIEQSIEINVSVHTAYKQLTRIEEYPRFMEGVKAVRRLDATHLHWSTTVCGQDVQWDAEITEQVPDRSIAWRNTGDRGDSGKVELQQTENGKTRVLLRIDMDTQQPARVREPDEDPLKAMSWRMEQDLVRFKKFIETGVRPATDAERESYELL